MVYVFVSMLRPFFTTTETQTIERRLRIPLSVYPSTVPINREYDRKTSHLGSVLSLERVSVVGVRRDEDNQVQTYFLAQCFCVNRKVPYK